MEGGCGGDTSTPLLLMQTWKNYDLPPKFKVNHDRWVDMLDKSKLKNSIGVGWTEVIFDDKDLRGLVEKYAPHHLKSYDAFTENIERVDFARYLMMYLGGVYADLDTYPVRPIDHFVAMGKIVLGREPLEHARKYYDREIVLCNALMISPPKQKLWLELMDYIVSNYEPHYNAVWNTGPMAMTKFMEERPELFKDVVITDPCVFFPLTGDGKVARGCDIERDSYVIHEWQNSWVQKNIFDDPRWKNRRYWTAALIGLIIVVLYVYIIYK